MNINSDEVILKMMINDLEERIKLLQKKNDEMKKMVNLLFEITKQQEDKSNGNL